MQKIIILAGNYNEFKYYLEQKKDKDRYIYGEFPDRMRGLDIFDVEVVGTFWERKDAGKLYNFARELLR